MPLKALSIDGFRNIESVKLQFSPRLNLFIGDNAAGKTSLLEALFVLARARSFRTRDLGKTIQSGETGFRLVAAVCKAGGEREIPVGMSRSEKKLIARIDSKPVKQLSELAALFPIQWLGGNLHRLIEEGPAFRRQYLDWGLFHVKQTYLQAWKRFQKLLKQRNAALRKNASAKEISAWDIELATSGEELHQVRERYIVELESLVSTISAGLLNTDGELKIAYRRGWARDISYRQALESGLTRDRELGYTREGPQRAELVFLYRRQPLIEQFSRGQLKLFVIALKVAQVQLLQRETSQTSLFLMDDIGAELDGANQLHVLRLLQSVGAQVFVTAINDIEDTGWKADQAGRFHVKHGVITEVV
ncbi:MAG: DNA replication/repair protein RecF [Gammaproteobacteria bacterium]|nr:MAG: DNA replication/repair protein RecF [Gammaproteobacteria bacterium]